MAATTSLSSINNNLIARLQAKKPVHPYLIDGVRFTREEYLSIAYSYYSFQNIMSLRNIEQRRVALKYIGIEKLLAKKREFFLADKSKRGNELWVTKNRFSYFSSKAHWSSQYEIFLYFLKYICPSTERIYVSAVDGNHLMDSLPRDLLLTMRNIGLVREHRLLRRCLPALYKHLDGFAADTAMAWKLHLTLKEYRNIDAEA